jgi:hypothetical protein
LTDADGPKLVARVVGRALGLPAAAAEGLPKDVLVLATAKMPQVVVDGLAPKAALLKIARAIANV